MGNQVRNFIAGAVGGIVGGWVKLQCEALIPPRSDGREAPPSVLIKQIVKATGFCEPSNEFIGQGTMAVHWIFSAMFGGIYGMLAEGIPTVRTGEGAGFGLAVWIGAHELTLPASGLTPILPKLPLTEQYSEAFSHLGYGISLELTRKLLRATLLC